MSIVYYVSSHGFGHAARSARIMRAIPSSIPLHIRTGAAGWFFAQELLPERPFQLSEAAFDCGALEGPNGIDREKTFHRMAELQEQNEARLEAEAEWLRRHDARLVVSDIPPFPFVAARRAGIPSALIANFTWVEIYRHWLDDLPQFTPLVDELQRQYKMADVAYVTALDMEMPWLPNPKRMPLVTHRGPDRREEIAGKYNLDPRKAWALVYIGRFGNTLDGPALERMPEYQFLTFDRSCSANGANLTIVDNGDMPHPDVIATVDVVVAKAGYGMVGECMASGTPMIYTDRDYFPEFDTLDRALKDWGGAIRIPRDMFGEGRWEDALKRVLQLKPSVLEKIDGAWKIAATLAETWSAASQSRNTYSSSGETLK